MYPGTIFKWHDQSAIASTEPAVVVENRPLFLAASSFDRGPEEMKIVNANNFRSLYGTKLSFEKHGQAAIQVKNIIDNGGAVLLKRVVAADSTLANTILVASININLTATPDTTGDPKAKTLAEITSGQSTDTSTKYLVESNSTLKWTAVSIANAKTFESVVDASDDLQKDAQFTVGSPDADGVVTITGTADYPLLVIGDNGRGVSSKSVRLTADYNSSKNIDAFFYAAVIYDGTELLGTTMASFDDSVVLNGVNYGFNEFTTEHVKFFENPKYFDKYIDQIVDVTGIAPENIVDYDVIFAKDIRQNAMPGLSLAADSIDLNATYGVSLSNGTNGAFGDYPVQTEEYVAQMVDFFSGNFDDAIFDLDQYKICAVFDADYDPRIKNAIAELVTFREDCFFFRDLGSEVKSYASIVAKVQANTINNKFIGDYLTNYEIYDPNNGKRIRVTMMYDLAAVMVSHFANGAYRPVAGIANNLILPSAIEGTINFVPRITPRINQKDLLEDIRVNYATFDSDTRQCVVQSLYTSQDAMTQLSYINNVLGIQEVARAVRTACPKNRYTFASGVDFTAYSTDVNNVLANYRNNFNELSFEYTQNAVYAIQKIFCASIKFRFNNWAQTEYFDLYALPTESNVEQ